MALESGRHIYTYFYIKYGGALTTTKISRKKFVLDFSLISLFPEMTMMTMMMEKMLCILKNNLTTPTIYVWDCCFSHYTSSSTKKTVKYVVLNLLGQMNDDEICARFSIKKKRSGSLIFAVHIPHSSTHIHTHAFHIITESVIRGNSNTFTHVDLGSADFFCVYIADLLLLLLVLHPRWKNQVTKSFSLS